MHPMHPNDEFTFEVLAGAIFFIIISSLPRIVGWIEDAVRTVRTRRNARRTRPDEQEESAMHLRGISSWDTHKRWLALTLVTFLIATLAFYTPIYHLLFSGAVGLVDLLKASFWEERLWLWWPSKITPAFWAHRPTDGNQTAFWILAFLLVGIPALLIQLTLLLVWLPLFLIARLIRLTIYYHLVPIPLVLGSSLAIYWRITAHSHRYKLRAAKRRTEKRTQNLSDELRRMEELRETILRQRKESTNGSATSARASESPGH